MIHDRLPAVATRGALPAGAGPVLLTIARQSITAALDDQGGPRRWARRGPSQSGPNAHGGRPARGAWLDEPGATFVTLTASDGSGPERSGPGRLRGCIGTLEPRRPLRADVAANAVAAATRDRRFPPVTADELPRIAIEVSVLSPAVLVTAGQCTVRRGVNGPQALSGTRGPGWGA